MLLTMGKFIGKFTISVAPNTLGDRRQVSHPTSRDAFKRPITRSQPVMLEQRPNIPNLSAPMVDLTVNSSSESSVGSNSGLQVVQDSSPVEKRQRLEYDSPPIRFANQPQPTSQHHASTNATFSPPTVSTAQLPNSSTSSYPQTHIVPHLHLRPLLSTNFLASVLPIRGLFFSTGNCVFTGPSSSLSFRGLRAAFILSVSISPRSTSG